MKRHLKYALEVLLVPVAAGIIFFEQTLIRYLNMVTAAFARLKWVARLEAWLLTLPPWAAFLAFAAPSILILPIKLSALWFATHKHYTMAVGAIVFGKLLATAIVARLYKVLRPNLMSMRWFAWADTTFFYWRDRAYAFVKAMPAWQRAKALIARSKAWLQKFRRSLLAGGKA
jgi:hypothetical protein